MPVDNFYEWQKLGKERQPFAIALADRRPMAMLDEAALSYAVVLTKCDQVKPEALAKLAAATASDLAKHPAAYPALYLTSAHDGSGIAELRGTLAELAAGGGAS